MTDTVRIMQLCGARHAGGAEAFYLRLCRALHRHPGAHLLPVVRKDSWLAQQLAEDNIPHEQVPYGRRFDLLSRLRLKRLIRSFRPDVAQTWMNRASSHLPRGLVPSVGRLGGYYDLKYYAGLNHLIGNTEDICAYIRGQGWAPESVHYIPNFVDIPPAGFKITGDALRRQLQIPDEAVVLLIAARLHPVKGIDVALEALAKLPPHMHLIIAGEGPEEATLKQLAQRLGIAARCHFTGWINDITQLYAASDILVVSSRKEPLGNVVLEGWAHAMPLVSSEAEGPSQLITHRQDGLLVPIGDAGALAQAINEIAGNPNLAVLLAETGLETLQRNFSEQAVVNQYLDFYRQLKEQQACAA